MNNRQIGFIFFLSSMAGIDYISTIIVRLTGSYIAGLLTTLLICLYFYHLRDKND